jgi:hypothetical protein
MDHVQIQATVQEIAGQKCERASNPHGSILSLDFGPLSLRPDEAPDSTPHGWRHLTVLSPWRLQTDREVISDWNVEGGAEGYVTSTLKLLIGQKVVSVETEPPAWDLRIRWENGLTLVVFGDCTDDRDDAWFILGTDGVEIGATPAVRPIQALE